MPNADDSQTVNRGLMLREYDALRNELSARSQNRFSLLTVYAALLAPVLKDGAKLVETLVPIGVVSTVVLGVWLYLGLAIKRLGDAIARIEGRSKLKGQRRLPFV